LEGGSKEDRREGRGEGGSLYMYKYILFILYIYFKPLGNVEHLRASERVDEFPQRQRKT
jgi:hypothetical protein